MAQENPVRTWKPKLRAIVLLGVAVICVFSQTRTRAPTVLAIRNVTIVPIDSERIETGRTVMCETV
jgi:hypothetical protein